MTEQTAPDTAAHRGRCGCGHGAQRRTQPQVPDQSRTPTETTADFAAHGVIPGRKSGNMLGLRDVSARPQHAGCGCGGSSCGCGGH